MRRTRIYNNVILLAGGEGKLTNQMVRMDRWNGWPTDALFANNLFNARRPVSYRYGSARQTRFSHNAYVGPHDDRPDVRMR